MLNESLAELRIQKVQKSLNTYILYTRNRSIQKPWQKEVDMLVVIHDWLFDANY